MIIEEFQAGRMFCSKIRHYLIVAQQSGYKFNFTESSGILSHKFTLNSQDNTATILVDDIRNQCEEMGIPTGEF